MMVMDWSQVLTAHLGSPSESDIRSFERELGFRLPNDYVRFLRQFNGGKIIVDHEIPIRALDSDIFINYLMPFSAKSPFLGVLEARVIQVANRQCLRQALKIGDDMGTGFYYVILAGELSGAVFFIYKDDVPQREADWFSDRVEIPTSMVQVAPDFDALGQLILTNRLA
jgi:hypothetical protein